MAKLREAQFKNEPNDPNEHKRRHLSDDQKATIVRRHLGDKVPVGDLADDPTTTTNTYGLSGG